MRITHKALAVIAVCFAIGWSIFCALGAGITSKFSQKAGFFFHRIWGKGWCAIMGVKVTFEGLENIPKSCVLASNHESVFDIFVIAGLPVHVRWISKESVGRLPFIGWAMRGIGCFFVKRDKSGHDLNVMKEVEDALREGAIIMIFPEGTRSRTGELLPFKKGAFKTALNAGVPLVPVGIHGTRSIAPPKKWPERRGHHARVRIGKPVPTADRPPMEQLMEVVRKDIESLRVN